MKSPSRSVARLLIVGLIFAAAVAFGPSARAQTAPQLYAAGLEAIKSGDIPSGKEKLQEALQVDRNFRPASDLLARIAKAEKPPAAVGATASSGTPVKALSVMNVPVQFKDTSLQSALEFIRQRVETESNGAVKVNFVLNLPPETQNKPITLDLSHVPVMETLRYIGNLASVKFDVQPYAIVVSPASAAPAPGPEVSPAANP